MCLFFTWNRSFYLSHLAHPVSVPIVAPRDIQSPWSQNHDTEIPHTDVVCRVHNVMPCLDHGRRFVSFIRTGIFLELFVQTKFREIFILSKMAYFGRFWPVFHLFSWCVVASLLASRTRIEICILFFLTISSDSFSPCSHEYGCITYTNAFYL